VGQNVDAIGTGTGNTRSGTMPDERKLGSRWDQYSTGLRVCVIELSVDRGQGLGDCLSNVQHS
jgi:hypothetical protein